MFYSICVCIIIGVVDDIIIIATSQNRCMSLIARQKIILGQPTRYPFSLILTINVKLNYHFLHVIIIYHTCNTITHWITSVSKRSTIRRWVKRELIGSTAISYRTICNVRWNRISPCFRFNIVTTILTLKSLFSCILIVFFAVHHYSSISNIILVLNSIRDITQIKGRI